jgi:hypothetical protein
MFADEGLEAWEKRFYTAYATVLHTKDLPFVYLACQLFTHENDEGKAAFIGIDFHSFYSERRLGPALLGGVVHYESANKVDQGLINLTARLPGYDDRFKLTRSKPDDPIVRHTPTEYGKSGFPGVVEVRHIEVPLSDVGDLERLAGFVRAIRAMYAGDDAQVGVLFKGLTADAKAPEPVS